MRIRKCCVPPDSPVRDSRTSGVIHELPSDTLVYMDSIPGDQRYSRDQRYSAAHGMFSPFDISYQMRCTQQMIGLRTGMIMSIPRPVKAFRAERKADPESRRPRTLLPGDGKN